MWVHWLCVCCVCVCVSAATNSYRLESLISQFLFIVLLNFIINCVCACVFLTFLWKLMITSLWKVAHTLKSKAFHFGICCCLQYCTRQIMFTLTITWLKSDCSFQLKHNFCVAVDFSFKSEMKENTRFFLQALVEEGETVNRSYRVVKRSSETPKQSFDILETIMRRPQNDPFRLDAEWMEKEPLSLIFFRLN